jgi:NDP-sugar pyrophosphorylase family protein
MKAMVLAAGLGTRLRPLTDNCPKALVEVAGRTLLEITLARLQLFGIREVIVNVHHLADQIVEYLKANANFGMRIEISREDDLLLDTGGGLKKAAWFFLEDSTQADEPFLLHNVDVISTIDFAKMVRAHKANKALATLAVQKRESSRQLLFDEHLQLCGRRAARDREPEIVRPSPRLEPLAFSGIHIISPGLLRLLSEDGIFSIITSYLRLAGQNENIQAFRAEDYYWRDLGRIEDLQLAEQDLQQNAALQEL